ncbi:contactin-5-like [Pomacea canaliculata]|uniref:contactin-5-like n=1 Tax=Pomacea canaliculata TaxID=400727 RepID=UPI000D72CF46|nr:contactin-5-like [Pomacea canaliculata]
MSSCHHVNSHLFGPRLPLLYTWRRDNGPIPQKASFLDDRRVLILPDAQVEDSGNYTCRVERAGRATDSGTISLLVQAAPFFMFPLRDQHVDINSTVSLRCQAGGVPTPTYAWFKNGQPLTSIPDDVEVSGNVVVIKKAEPARHSGMYECSATNLHGTRISSAQLRILAFAPSSRISLSSILKWPPEKETRPSSVSQKHPQHQQSRGLSMAGFWTSSEGSRAE